MSSSYGSTFNFWRSVKNRLLIVEFWNSATGQICSNSNSLILIKLKFCYWSNLFHPISPPARDQLWETNPTLPLIDGWGMTLKFSITSPNRWLRSGFHFSINLSIIMSSALSRLPYWDHPKKNNEDGCFTPSKLSRFPYQTLHQSIGWSSL